MDAFIHSTFSVRSFIAVGLVLGLTMLAVWLSRILGLSAIWQLRDQQSRLSIVERLALDSKRRLILVRRDHNEHLLCISGEQILLVEKDIKERLDFDEESLLSIAQPFSGKETA